LRSFAFICGGFKLWKVWSGLATSGFTALELLITVAILGLVTSLAVPALRDFVLEKRAVSGLNEFMAAVNFARNEAVRREGISDPMRQRLAPGRETRMRC